MTVQSRFTRADKSHPVYLAVPAGPQGLFHFDKNILRWNILPPLVGQWNGATQLAINAVPVTGLERDRVNT